MTLKYFIKELECNSCAKAIEKNLNKINVDDVEFDIMSQGVWIHYDESKLNQDDIEKALKKSGFTFELVKDE